MTPATTLARDFLKEPQHETDTRLSREKPRAREQFSTRFDRFVSWFSANLTGQYQPADRSN